MRKHEELIVGLADRFKNIEHHKSRAGLVEFSKYHPLFTNIPVGELDELSRFIKTETIVEEVLSHINPKLLLDHEPGQDYDDGSDCKFSAMTSPASAKSYQVGQRSQYYTEELCIKNGALRFILYNTIKDCLEFFYLPKHVWLGMVTWGSTNFVIRFSFPKAIQSKLNDKVIELYRYKVNSLVELANAKG